MTDTRQKPTLGPPPTDTDLDTARTRMIATLIAHESALKNYRDLIERRRFDVDRRAEYVSRELMAPTKRGASG